MEKYTDKVQMAVYKSDSFGYKEVSEFVSSLLNEKFLIKFGDDGNPVKMSDFVIPSLINNGVLFNNSIRVGCDTKKTTVFYGMTLDLRTGYIVLEGNGFMYPIYNALGLFNTLFINTDDDNFFYLVEQLKLSDPLSGIEDFTIQEKDIPFSLIATTLSPSFASNDIHSYVYGLTVLGSFVGSKTTSTLDPSADLISSDIYLQRLVMFSKAMLKLYTYILRISKKFEDFNSISNRENYSNILNDSSSFGLNRGLVLGCYNNFKNQIEIKNRLETLMVTNLDENFLDSRYDSSKMNYFELNGLSILSSVLNSYTSKFLNANPDTASFMYLRCMLVMSTFLSEPELYNRDKSNLKDGISKYFKVKITQNRTFDLPQMFIDARLFSQANSLSAAGYLTNLMELSGLKGYDSPVDSMIYNYMDKEFFAKSLIEPILSNKSNISPEKLADMETIFNSLDNVSLFHVNTPAQEKINMIADPSMFVMQVYNAVKSIKVSSSDVSKSVVADARFVNIMKLFKDYFSNYVLKYIQ